MPPRLAGAAVQAHLAAALFALGAILLAVGRGIENGHGGVGLDPMASYSQRSNGFTNDRSFLDYRFEDERVHDRWDARAHAAAPMLLGHLAAALGWLFSLPAVTSLSNVLGGGERSASSTVVYAFVAAAVLTIVEFTSEAGTAQTSAWISSWKLLKDPSRNNEGELTAAQAFEMSYMLTVSRTLWLYAADDLLLGIALGTASWLQMTSKVATSNRHAVLGLATALACVFDFCFEVNRFQSWRWSNNAVIVTTLTIDVVLLPAWLVWLGVLLRRVETLGGAFDAVGIERGDDSRTRSRVEPAVSGPGGPSDHASDLEMAPAAASGGQGVGP